MIRRNLLPLIFGLVLFSVGACNAESVATKNAESNTSDAITEEIVSAKIPQAEQASEPEITDRVLIETSLGTITIGLYGKAAPISVENFLNYVNAGFYDGTIFHRVMATFMIQGGGFDEGFAQKPTQPPIKNEATNGLSNKTGTVAMARTGIVDSATSQFFINVVDNDFLNHSNPSPRGYGYAVFGKVIDGMETVAKIKVVPTAPKGPHANAPVEAVTMLKVEVVK